MMAKLIISLVILNAILLLILCYQKVGFHDETKVYKYFVKEKNKDILKALNKTKVEKFPGISYRKAYFFYNYNEENRFRI